MLRANAPNNVVIHPVALCDHVGSVSFAEGEDIDQCAIAEEGIAVEATTIDALDLKPDFIKIDVEGAEPLVLAGARNTIRKHSPLIYFEALDDDAFAASRAEILKAGKYEFVSFGDNHLATPSRP